MLVRIQYLFRGSYQCSVNGHAMSLVYNCGFCEIPYRAIVKMETFTEDIRNIWRMAGVVFHKQPKNVEKKYLVNFSICSIQSVYVFHSIFGLRTTLARDFRRHFQSHLE